jgi:hypothetical protein
MFSEEPLEPRQPGMSGVAQLSRRLAVRLARDPFPPWPGPSSRVCLSRAGAKSCEQPNEHAGDTFVRHLIAELRERRHQGLGQHMALRLYI